MLKVCILASEIIEKEANTKYLFLFVIKNFVDF